jgi:hypothetical protein
MATGGYGPWIDVGNYPNAWSIHVVNANGFTVEVSNQIPTPYSYTSQNPNSPLPSYPPFGPPTDAGVVVQSAYILTSGTQALVMSKSDLNVKWVRVHQATPGTTLAFLHVGIGK